MKILNIVKKIYKKLMFGYKSSSESYKKYLIKKGISIGKNVTFYEPNTNYIDTQKSFLVSIGNNVEITRNVIILTHDYSWAVLKQKYGPIIGARGSVKIGNNVFIGMNSIIMKDVEIGDNVIIGANSVVCGNIPSNSVVCGNPAKVLCSLEEYYDKRAKKYESEAINMFIEFYKKYNEIPPKNIFDEFFWLFEKRESEMSPEFKKKMELTGNTNETYACFKKNQPKYNGYDEFVKMCIKIYNEEFRRK